MIRILHVVAISLLIASAAYAYSIKYDTLYYAEQLAKLKSKLQREKDTIAVARAEWALLTRPERLQTLVDQHLDLPQMSYNQLANFSDLPTRPTGDDEIGRKLEALGLETTATPKDKQTGGARTPSAVRPAR